MKPGQRIQRWWQEYVLGHLQTPQDLISAARREAPETDFRLDGAPISDRWAPQRMADSTFFASAAYARQGFRADWQHTDRRLQYWAAKVCLTMKKRGIPVFVHSAFRGREEQNALLERGVTKARFPLSAHNIGEAVDIVHSQYFWDLSKDEWLYIHHVGQEELRKLNSLLPSDKRLSLNWGGDDQSSTDRFRWDPAHWEITDFRNRRDVKGLLPEGLPVHTPPSLARL